MIKNILVGIIVSFLMVTSSLAHDFDTEAIGYILSNQEASWTDFESHMLGIDEGEFENTIASTESKLATALSLPGKKYVINYAQGNANFTFTDIQKLIQDDPMLSEIGAEPIYSFLHSTLQLGTGNTMTFSFFLQFIRVGFQHIMGGVDHMLFLLTLVICLPKLRRILIVITTFTIAHSLTIILGGMNVLAIPSVIVESMILISIIIMGVYALLKKVGASMNARIENGLVGVLGLFHGLGFAGFFRSILDLSENIFLPIFAFNIGVEIGQVLILILSIGVLSVLYNSFPKQKEHMKNVLAIVSIFVALIFLVQSFI